MCQNCGINHETGVMEDADAVESFLARLLEAFQPEEITSFMDEYRTEPDIILSGEDWKVAVAKVGGTSDVTQEYAFGEEWIIDRYERGELVYSGILKSGESMSTQRAAEEFAGYFYNYIA